MDNPIEYLAIIAQVMFVLATAFQTKKCYDEGHADGLSHALIWMLITGLTIMLVYIPIVIGFDLILLGGYIGQLLLFIVIAKYKYWPRAPIVKNYVDNNDFDGFTRGPGRFK